MVFGRMGDFKGFGPKALGFFKALAFHQTKEWYDSNKPIYEEHVREPFGLLISDVSAGLSKKGVGVNPVRPDTRLVEG